MFFEKRLRFDKVTESLKVRNFLRHSVDDCHCRLYPNPKPVRCCAIFSLCNLTHVDGLARKVSDTCT